MAVKGAFVRRGMNLYIVFRLHLCSQVSTYFFCEQIRGITKSDCRLFHVCLALRPSSTDQLDSHCSDFYIV